MSPQSMIRTFTRTHHKGMVDQQMTKRISGEARSYRTPAGRALLAQNQAYSTLKPSLRTR